MKRILILSLVLAPLLLAAQKGYQYEYILRVSGIQNHSTLKLVYHAIQDLDNDAQISYNDEFTELKYRSNSRLTQVDFSNALLPFDVNVLNLSSTNSLRSEYDRTPNAPTQDTNSDE